ncbi:SGNH/GDSL hydrolase family protein [Klebsiella pneumoniae]
MAELNPPLGTTSPEIFLDNVKRADELVNGPAGTVNDRGGEPLDTWRQMMAKNDEVRQNLIPLSKQYVTLAAAQADIANIPEGSTTYVRSADGSTLAEEYMNVGGTLQPTGRWMPSKKTLDGSLSYNGYIPEDSAFKVLDGQALNASGALVSRNDASSLVYVCHGYSSLYMVSSAGDFSPRIGRGVAFFDSLINYNSPTLIAQGWPVDTGETDPDGMRIYRLEVPVSAVSIIINMKWDQFNPTGFTVKVYSTLSAAISGDENVNALNQSTIADNYFPGVGCLDLMTVDKVTGSVFSGNMIDAAYLERIDFGVNASGVYKDLSTATSRAIDVSGLRRIYAVNSAGDFSLSRGRGCCIFNDKYNLKDNTSLGVPLFYKQGKTISGLDIYTVDLPLDAVSLVVNTAFTQYNPTGFFVGIYATADAAKNELSGIGSRRITSILGGEILGINIETDVGYDKTGVLTSTGTENPINYGINSTGFYINLSTAKSRVFNVKNYDFLYLYNSVGNFSAGAGRGASFFKSMTDFSDDNFIKMPDYAVYGVALDGMPVYKVVIPEDAVSLVVNTEFTQFNPAGFTVGVYTDLALALSLSLEPPSRRITSILGEEILDLSKVGGRDKFGISRLAGETVFIFGDSISTTNYNGGWVPYFADATKCRLINFATNGSKADRMVDKLCIDGLARRAVSDTQVWPKPDFSTCKAVMLMIGTNDRPQIPAGGIESIIPSGNLASAPDPLTYWNSFPNEYVGNVALFIEYVKYQNPATEIYLMSNVHIASDKTVMERVSLLCAQIAEYYSIPHIDATHNAGFSYKFINNYLTDGLHPTLQGNMLLGAYIASAVMSA